MRLQMRTELIDNITGDFTPHTHLGRSLFIPMAVGGILFVGLIVASISACVLEAGSKKVATRNVEKARQAVMRKMTASGEIRVSIFHKKRNITLAKGASQIQQRAHEFYLMRLVQQKAAWDNALVALGLSLGIFSSIWFLGSVVFWRAELETGGWSYFESLYFTYVSFLTIGYGDFEVC
jgi:potassium channel subfamily K